MCENVRGNYYDDNVFREVVTRFGRSIENPYRTNLARFKTRRSETNVPVEIFDLLISLKFAPSFVWKESGLRLKIEKFLIVPN